MAHGTFLQVWEYAPQGRRYVQQQLGLDGSTADDVVQDVLLRLLLDGPERLEKPKRYFLRACRWRALEIHRERRRRKKAFAEVERQRRQVEEKDPEILVALEDEDKPKFFDLATPKQQEVLELIIEGHSQEEISAILEIPSSTVRMRLHLTRRRLGIPAA